LSAWAASRFAGRLAMSSTDFAAVALATIANLDKKAEP
jgi:hypothetical protein